MDESMERIYITDEDRLDEACELTVDYNEGLDGGDRILVQSSNLYEAERILSENDIDYDIV